MSNELTNLVWASDIQPLPKRMTLLALAYAANEDGVCWPGVDLLVQRVGAGRSTVLQYLAELAEEGYINRQRRRSRSNVYTVVRERLQQVGMSRSRTIQEPDEPAAGPSTNGTVQQPALGRSSSRTFLKGKIKEPSNDPHRKTIKPRNVGGYTSEFEAWWDHYPRKVDKLHAFRKFKTALQVTDAGTLMASVKRFATEMAGREPEHIKHAATWLHGRCWENGADSAGPGSTVEQVRAWLNAEWEAGRVGGIEERTGLRYPQPDLPLDLPQTEIERWLLDRCRQWMAANRDLIIERLTARSSA